MSPLPFRLVLPELLILATYPHTCRTLSVIKMCADFDLGRANAGSKIMVDLPKSRGLA